MRKNVDLVLVTDESNRVIIGLDKGNFQLYDSKQAQNIKYFCSGRGYGPPSKLP